MDQSGNTQNRRQRRSNVLMKATVELSGLALDVRMRNLSEDGALIEGDRLPVEGSEILFRKGDLSVAGQIAWTKGRQAGIAFSKPLATELVLRHMPPPRPRVIPSFKRPGLLPRPLSAEERQLCERWIFGKPLPPIGD